jgi:DNA-binding transcriptional LysR family regulator
MQLTIKQVRYFLAAAETGQFSAAADQVHVTQTAITSAIRELEETLGVQLFYRHHATGVSLSAEGQRFHSHAQNIMTAVAAAMATPSLLDKRIRGRLRVAATHAMLGYYIIPAIHRFSTAYDKIDVELVEMTRPRLEQALLLGDADAGVLWLNNLENTTELESVTIAHSRRQLWTGADHPLLQRKTLSIADLRDFPYALLDVDEVERTTLGFWALHGLTPNVTLRTSSIEAIRTTVGLNRAVTILSDVAYRPWSREGFKIETRPLLEGLPSIDIGLVHQRGNDSAPLQALLNFLKLAVNLQGFNGSPG